jgi:4-amino-4-deoxy-L-arabinose transferase-like glycosyltransferase
MMSSDQPLEKPCKSTEGTHARWVPFVLAAILIVYIAITVLFALTRQPWCDEAWFASPAINLLRKGYMGTSIREVAGFPFTGLDRHTYWQPPLYFLAQAGWYSIFGFSLFSMRMMSVTWGLVCLLAIYSMIRSVTKSLGAALLAVGLVAIDFVFISAAGNGRMDMMSAALAYSGFAVYLSQRRKNLLLAVLAGNTLIVASGLTHPNGILALIGLIALVLVYDRKNIRIKHVLVALIPYLVGGIGWGLYIAQDPTAFVDQFTGNMQRQLMGVLSILKSFQLEITARYLPVYGFTEGSSLFAKLKILILLGYLAGVIGLLLTPDLRRRKGVRALLYLLLVYLVTMSILIGNKTESYLVQILPLFISLAAIWFTWCWGKSTLLRAAAICILAIILVLQTGTDLHRIQADSYHRTYLPAIERLRELDDDSRVIMGSAELAFALGFDSNLIDDPRLGYISGRSADALVIETRYDQRWERYAREEPETYRYITDLIDTEYQLVYRNEFYRIYVRKNADAPN